MTSRTDPATNASPTNAPRPVRILLVVAAASGAGKTTLLEALIPLLAAAGLRVGAVKRTHHDVDLDVPGKDSDRLRRAGASPVILRAPRTTTLIAPTTDGDDLDALAAAAAALGPIDLLVVEGGRSLERHPRIEVVAPGGRAADAPPGPVIATVYATDAEARASTRRPSFQRDDVAAIARCILEFGDGPQGL